MRRYQGIVRIFSLVYQTFRSCLYSALARALDNILAAFPEEQASAVLVSNLKRDDLTEESEESESSDEGSGKGGSEPEDGS